jgi:5'(3')-deoxyribonucleotidase
VEAEAGSGYDAPHRAVKQKDLFLRLPPIAGAPATLRRLSKLRIRIRIITHRLYIEWFHREAIQTTEWLEEHGVPYWDLCFMRDKAAVGADLYLEDNPSNIRLLRAAGHRTIVVTNSINRGVRGPRADTWDEVERLVVRDFYKWRQQRRRK